jgi:hypothetical protein
MNMLKRMLALLVLAGGALLAVSGGAQAEDYLKPFVLASKGTGDFAAKVTATKSALTGAGFEILGEYSPYSNTFVDNAEVIIVTNNELKSVAMKTKFGGFAAPWRVAVTQVGGEVQVAFANPLYLANAYRLDGDLAGVSEALKGALGYQEEFGSERGLSARKLRKYHYTFGMEYFDDPYKLAKYDDHQAAIDTLEKNLAAGVAGVTKVYRFDLSNDVTIFGVARKAPSEAEIDMDEHHIMQEVDFAELKGTAYLPYEIMVDGNDVYAQHMRFRMAVHYPDLKMMGQHSFMNLMASPNAIEKALAAAAGGK